MTRTQYTAILSLPLASAALLAAQFSCPSGDAVRTNEAAAVRVAVETQFAIRFCGSQYRSQSDVMRCLDRNAR